MSVTMRFDLNKNTNAGAVAIRFQLKILWLFCLDCGLESVLRRALTKTNLMR
jgi:hypothetical protein